MKKQDEHLLYEYHIALSNGCLERVKKIELANPELAKEFTLAKNKYGYRHGLENTQ